MNKLRFSLTALAMIAFTLMIASSTRAQAVRTWVSGVGDDVNPCSRTAPCRTFAGAISKTATNGEISALDPGSFGAVTINKGLSLNGEGTLAGVTNQLINGVTVNAPATDTVNIRHLAFNGLTSGLSAIRFIAGKNLNVENVYINGSATGIEVSKSADGQLSVVNTTIKNCTGAGIKAETSAGIARVTVRNTTITNCATGIQARKNSRVAVFESTISANTLGVHAEGNGGTAVAVLKFCQVANNTSHGVQAGGGAATASSVVRLSNNIINNNAGAGVSTQANGSVETFANNEITGNNPDGCVGCVNITTSID